MKLRLFGKILLAFWLTLFVMSQGFWLVYEGDRGPLPSSDRTAIRIAPPVLTLLARRVATSGPAEAQRDRLLLPRQFRDRISILPSSVEQQLRKSGGFRVTQDAVAPNGHRYVLVYQPSGKSSGPLDIPAKLLWGSAAAGLIFSLALTIYLTRPLMMLREGFRRVAQGDLDVQLEHKVGRREDEISDLARDFDLMAVRLRQLITARDRLLNDVSHELRSPLTRLQLASGLRARIQAAPKTPSTGSIARRASSTRWSTNCSRWRAPRAARPKRGMNTSIRSPS